MNSFKGSIYNRHMDVKIVKTSNNIIQETVLSFLRFWSSYYEFNTTSESRREIINMIINILPKYKIKKLLNIIASIEINKGKIVNKLNIFSNNVDLIKDLYKGIKDPCLSSEFEKQFNNFELN